MKRVFITALLTSITIPLFSACQKTETPPAKPEEQLKSIQLTIRESRRNNIEVTDNEDGTITLKPTGLDPFVFFDIPLNTDGSKYQLEEYSQLAFESFNTSNTDLALVIFVGAENPSGAVDSSTGYAIPQSSEWVNNSFDMTKTPVLQSRPSFIRVRFGINAGPAFKIKNPVLRQKSKADKDKETALQDKIKADEELANRIVSYFKTTHTSQITSVSGHWGNASLITIKGNYSGGEMKGIGLAEIGLWQDQTALNVPLMFEPLTTPAFTRQLDRFAEDGHDRLLSSWAVVRKNGDKYELLSAAKYVADDIEAKNNFTPFAPQNIKGLGGCEPSHPDYSELGVTAMSTNMILRDILSRDDTNGTYEYAGKKWRINTSGLTRTDNEIKAAYDRGSMVDVVLLIHTRHKSMDSWTQTVAHPDSRSVSAWAMPNMTDRDAVETYAATINFLAERYSGAQYGRIHRWICHNEIDAGWYWTDAGDKKIETYMNLYQRSMRLVQTLVRQYDPNAKTLISITQTWNTDHGAGAKEYKSKDCLNLMADFSRKEGDFEWGIAFHPYPQDLTIPETWNDSKALLSFDTEMITLKNPEVINDYAELPHMRYNGQTAREVRFTEQGVSSPSYSIEDQTRQAAALAYVFGKFDEVNGKRRLNNVAAFHYHIWGDYVYDVNLRCGLRTFAPERAKKIAYDVFKNYLDNPSAYKTQTDPYKTRIPGMATSDPWSKVQNKEKITAGSLGTIHVPVNVQ